MSTYVRKLAKEKGKRIVDAKDGLFLEVAPRDIQKARKGNSRHCAFAECLKRQEPVQAAYVFRTAAYLEYEDELVRYKLPPSMQKEIVAFDRNKTMEPGEYRLSPPSKTDTLDAVKKRNAWRTGRHQPAKTKIKRKIVRHHTDGIRSAKDPNAVGDLE